MGSVITGVFLPVWLDPEYTLGEKLAIWRGKWSAPSARLWNEMLASDLPALVPELEIPAYFLHGRHDYTVSRPLARAYLRQLRAPTKAFYSFEHSAHSPIFEEPERTRVILVEDVLAGRTALADPE
jgi:pimeloyl-ACP methyl ester carboxylesterase